MVFFVSVIVLTIISVVWAIWSIWGESGKLVHKKRLSDKKRMEKIIFRRHIR